MLSCARQGIAVKGARALTPAATLIRAQATASAATEPNMAATADVKSRAKAAVLGGLVADAASMGLHWIYKPDAMHAAISHRPSSATAPEFHEPPACPFYKAPSGDLSPYGYELYALLKYLAEEQASATAFDGNKCAQSLAASYQASTGYLNKSSKHVVSAVQDGKAFPETGHPEDAQANAFVKAPAIVALLSGSSQLPTVMEAAVRVQQNNAPAVSAGLAGAALLDKVVQGASVAEAVSWALSSSSGFSPETQQQLQAALGLKDQPFTVSVSQLGSSCGLPHSLQGSVLGAAKFPSYVEGVRANILAGGDNASRAVLLGALLAAQEGSVAAIPEVWRAKTNNYAEYERLTDALLAQRSA